MNLIRGIGSGISYAVSLPGAAITGVKNGYNSVSNAVTSSLPVTVVSGARNKIRNLAAWENTPTVQRAPYIRSSAETLAKFASRNVTGAISSLPTVAVATAIPFVATVASTTPVVVATSALAAGLWFFRSNHNTSASETLQKQKTDREQRLKKGIVDALGGDAAMAKARTKPVETASGVLEFKEENFPIDKAIVTAENSKKYIQYGLRIMDKKTKEVFFVTVGYEGGKLQVESPGNALGLKSSFFDKIAAGTHSQYELVAPQGKEITLLQKKLAILEATVKSQAKEIKDLKATNLTLEAKVDGLTNAVSQLADRVIQLEQAQPAVV